jgi:hypothetical protein
MPDFSIADSLGNPTDISKINWTSASSLLNYAKSESLHLLVVPDFISRKDKPLTAAAPDPTTFHFSIQHDFQLGSATPEVDLTPNSTITLTVNAKSGSNLFDGDAFHVPVKVPPQTGYVGLSLEGSLDLGVSGTSGDLTFGIDRNTGITIEYLKAFPVDRNEPTLGDATAEMLSSFVIPAGVADLDRLGVNDVCSVSGQGSLQVSGGVSVTTPVNPLASVNLPLGTGTLAIQGGAMAGLSVSFTISGSYQIRVLRLPGGAIQLSYLREAGTTLKTDLTASAGVSVDLGTTDLLAKLLGAFEKGGVDPSVLSSLSPDDVGDFTAAVKAGVDHSVAASIDLALSAQTDDQAAFQYEIRTELLNDDSRRAVERALKGDLTLITALEENAEGDGAIAPGIRLLNSVFSTARTKGATLKVNLLGIVNLISMTKLMNKCEFLFEPASGDLTIKETAQSEKIGAITDPVKKQDALRQALYYSVLATTTYVAGKAVTMPALACDATYFTLSRNTDKQTLAGYTNWFVALSLMTPDERAGFVTHFDEGVPSRCAVRTHLDDTLCEALFFDEQGKVRPVSEYQEIGRQALKGLLDPANGDIDRMRYQLLDDSSKWTRAVQIGPSPALGDLLPLSTSDPQFNLVLADVTGDLAEISWWAAGMQKAGQAIEQMRTFLAGRDPSSLAGDPGFAQRRDGLQKLMLGVVASSKLRFHEPLGIVCLFRAAGSRGSSGEITAGSLVIQRVGVTDAAAGASR